MDGKFGANPGSAHEVVDKMVGLESQSFDFEWEGGLRVPKIVTFPDGISKEVGYMRDGMINFTDGTVGKYERIVDDPKQSKQKIKISFNPKKMVY